MPNIRIILAFIHDLLAVALAWLLAHALRANIDLYHPYDAQSLSVALWLMPLYGAYFIRSGLYRGIWRFASLPDLQRIVISVLLGGLSVPALLFMLQVNAPRFVLILSPFILLLIMGGNRLAFRVWKARARRLATQGALQPVVILGATESASQLIKDMARSDKWEVVAIFDDNPKHYGQQLQGVEIEGPIETLVKRQAQLKAVHAVIAMPEAEARVRRRVMDQAREAGLSVMTVPSIEDLISGRVAVSRIRHIELDDLLGRDPIQLDSQGLQQWLGARSILVTGAGGSIGSELCRQIAGYKPQCIVLLENNEYSLYRIEQEFKRLWPNINIYPIVGDIRDAKRVDQVLLNFKPKVIFHAAAYKHVPLMENDNAWQAVQNNVRGTRTVAKAALQHHVEKFVLISTDKAVNPTNVMGATKRLAELVCQSLQGEGQTQFVIVRFGNVLGSTGSVIPTFREQIANGGPVTVTHPEITRFFMSIPEAVQLVLQAGLMGGSGEIFVLDMGEPVRIQDLARDMIRLSGFDENEIKITFTGLRPGEKLYEEVLADSEHSLPTPHPKLRIARVRAAQSHFLEKINPWLEQNTMPEGEEVRQDLTQWLPEYQPSQGG
jgi:FlaA1/EpsC-like NDP-sugar epimerase